MTRSESWHHQVELVLDQQDCEPALQPRMISSISLVSVGFMPAAAVEEQHARAQRERARDF